VPTDDAESYVRRAAVAPRLTKSEIEELVALARSGQPRPRARLIESHLRTVAQVARKYLKSDLSSEERFRFGEQGLGQAIDLFEPSKGFTFSTYAVWHIQRAILGGMSNGGGWAGVREPRSPRPIPGLAAASLELPP
jgi:RNA polymerase nonessential primary-like sigma factor